MSRPCIHCGTSWERCLERFESGARPPWCCPRCWRSYDKKLTHPEEEPKEKAE